MSVQVAVAPVVTRVGRDKEAGLFNRNFLLLSQAQLVSQFGNQAFTIAMMAWTMETTHSATMSGLMMMAGVLPIVLLGPLTGAVADSRCSRLAIVVTCDFAAGVLVLLLAGGFAAGPGTWKPAMLFTIALLIGVCNAFFDPALNAYVPDLVPHEQLEAANAFRQSSRQVTILTAQGLGGILYAVLGPAMLFLIDGVSFLFAAATESLITNRQSIGNPPVITNPQSIRNPPVMTNPQSIRTPQSAIRNARAGFSYVAAQPGMTGFLVMTSIFNVLLTPMMILLPVYATSHLQSGVRWYGFLLAAISAGAMTGGVAAGARRIAASGATRRLTLVAAFASLAIALAVLGQIRSREVALAILFLTGALSGMINVLMLSIVQRTTAVEFRGRVLGLHAMMTRILVPIGFIGGGILADLTGRNVPVVYGVCGGLALATVIALAGRRSTRAFLASC